MRLLLLSLGLGALREVVSAKARMGFVPTAGDPYADPFFVREERARLASMGYEMVDLDLSHETTEVLKEKLDSVDALFVAGGNTFFLMQQIRARFLSEAFSEFVASDRVYAGSSAGAVICGPTLAPFDALDDLSAAPDLHDLSGFQWVNFIVLPHYGQPSYYVKHQEAMMRFAQGNEFVPLCDDEAVWVTGPNQFEFRRSELVLLP